MHLQLVLDTLRYFTLSPLSPKNCGLFGPPLLKAGMPLGTELIIPLSSVDTLHVTNTLSTRASDLWHRFCALLSCYLPLSSRVSIPSFRKRANNDLREINCKRNSIMALKVRFKSMEL